jgi:CheY-like chemotaxis protein
MLRLLLVEDDPERITLFKAWSPPDVRLVVARGGGRALGLLERDPGRVYAGLLLDHDLPGQAVNDAERNVSGTQVAHCIQRYVDPDVPVLIHSMNPGGARRMAGFLATAGFDVSVIPMAKMTESHFLAWLDTVRSIRELLGPE